MVNKWAKQMMCRSDPMSTDKYESMWEADIWFGGSNQSV